jgi:hypothetical protein
MDQEQEVTKFPFEATFKEIKSNPDVFVTSVFLALESDFLTMPKGNGFVEYPVFERGYERLKQATGSYTQFSEKQILPIISSEPISFIVLRAMLGFSPPEWAYIASQRTGIAISQGFVRTIDRKIRMSPQTPLNLSGETAKRVSGLIRTACELLIEGAPNVEEGKIHRLDKADSKTGVTAIQPLSQMGVPYAMLLYERFLGRPFASHRDSVSDLIGGGLEAAIEDVLTKSGISYRKTKRAERIDGFDQSPDFIIPSEFNPQVIIEAKITEDDGTARDKATRIQHLGALSAAGMPTGEYKYEVIACIGGRGFGVQRGDMEKMLLATQGKIFTLKTMNRLVQSTRLKEFKST